MVACEFGPEEGISDQKFRKSIEKTWSAFNGSK